MARNLHCLRVAFVRFEPTIVCGRARSTVCLVDSTALDADGATWAQLRAGCPFATEKSDWTDVLHVRHRLRLIAKVAGWTRRAVCLRNAAWRIAERAGRAIEHMPAVAVLPEWAQDRRSTLLTAHVSVGTGCTITNSICAQRAVCSWRARDRNGRVCSAVVVARAWLPMPCVGLTADTDSLVDIFSPCRTVDPDRWSAKRLRRVGTSVAYVACTTNASDFTVLAVQADRTIFAICDSHNARFINRVSARGTDLWLACIGRADVTGRARVVAVVDSFTRAVVSWHTGLAGFLGTQALISSWGTR